MKRKGTRLCALLLTAALLLSLLPVAAFAAGEPAGQGLISPGLTVMASSEDSTSVKERAIDNDLSTQWSSKDMKTSATTENDSQTPQWLIVDLGEGRDYPIAIDSMKLCYNMKVWPMVYRVETSSDKTNWTPLVSVSRGPSNSGVRNGTGQNIASDPTGDLNTATTNGTNSDTITKTSVPSLVQNAAVQRYVRVYIEKVNTLAPGNNTGLREFQIYAPEPEPEPIVGAWNLALNQPATSSGCADSTSAGNAVDGNTTSTQWNSLNIKNFKVSDNSRDNEAQANPQWLQIDLGAPGSRLSEIRIHYVPNNKVWAMAYEIKTTNDPVNGTWDTLVSVSRPSANKAFQDLNPSVDGCLSIVTNEGDVHADVITRTSSPKLNSSVTVGRYIRIFFNKTNAQAPGGDNVNIREVEIFGVNDNRHQPVDVNAVLALATNSNVSANGSAVTVPAAPAGAGLAVVGSTLENVIANNGAIGGKNIGARDVTLLIRAWDEYDSSVSAQKNLTVTVPDHKGSYPTAWFPAVSSPNAKPEVIPAIQEWYGYNGSFYLTESSRIVISDAANVGLLKAAQNMKADVLEISGIDLPIVTGTSGGANDIYIESLTADIYDLGDEGYLMRVSDDGIKIYAPTYTGCIFGTITVEQILWQAADHLSIPKGIMRDYPAYEVRGIKLDIARTPYRYQQLQDYAKIMLWYKMSEYDLHINDNDNSNINGATFDTHSGFHRLESMTFPSLAQSSGTKHAGIPADLVNADYYNNNADYQGNPTYTKAQWRALQQLAQDYGMYLLTEIDLPGHSLLYNKYAAENPDNIDWLQGGTMPASNFTSNSGYLELLDLIGDNSERALRFARTLWDEYTSGSEPTIYGDIVDIGADEYWIHNDETNPAFATFANEMRKVIQGNLGSDTKIRMWGASSTSFSTATTTLDMTHEELAQHFQLDIWYPSYDNAALRCSQGYQVVNCRDAYMYGNPGRAFRDVPNAEYLFNDWNPTMFGGGNPLLGEPNLLGAKAVIWGDQSQEGMTERDIHQRVLRAIAIVSEKTWGGKTQSEGTFSDFELRFNRLAEGPGTQIAMEIPSGTSLVLDYDFANVSTDGTTVYDASGNGYNASLTGGAVDADGWLAFDGSTLLTTGLKTLSYPYTVSFKLKADAGNTAESSLFSGYDGRIQVAGHNGKMSADVNYFTRDFNYTVPTNGTAVDITIVGTQHATRLYVNGELKAFLSQKADNDGVAAGSVQTLYSSVLLPLEKIGQGFHGKLADIKVYNKAFSAQEVAGAYAGTDDYLVNVAQNAIAGGSSYQTGDAYDNAVQRVCTAIKAIDGEAFTDNTDASSEMWSYWRGDHADSALTVDLGQVRWISRVDLQWRTGGIGSGFKIQTSLDGKTWTDAQTVSGNTNARQTINLTSRNARFVRLQGVSGTYNLQEMLVYENVSALKAELADKLEAAEKVVQARGLGFESVEAGDRADFADVVFARAVLSSPLSTRANVQEAIDRLDDQLAALVTSITLDKTAATIYTNGNDPAHTVELTATVGPESATNKGINWTTSNPDVASVDDYGVVTGNGVGTAAITAAAVDGSEVYATCTVTVKTKLEHDIEITGDTKYDSVLTVQLNQLQMPEADQNRMSIQWYRTVGGVKEAITGATEQTYKLVKADIGAVISVTVIAADPYEGTRGASTGVVTKADGHAMLDANPSYVNCSAADVNDGQITGLRADHVYQYQKQNDDGSWPDGEGSWNNVPANSTEITGLAPGSYRVRHAGDDTRFAGEPSNTVTIVVAGGTEMVLTIPARFTGGIVRANRSQIPADDTVKLWVTPDTGYQLDSLVVNGADGSVVTPQKDSQTDANTTLYTFTMPASNATVNAVFVKKTYTITHELHNVNCSMEEHNHQVEHGDTPTITLTPAEGYQVPTSVTITVTGTTTEFKAYSYRYNEDRTSATVTFTGGVTSSLTISGEGVHKVYAIAHDLDNLVCSLPSNGHRVTHGAALSITLTPAEGFLPPREKGDITITMSGLPFSDFDYTLNIDNTGTIEIAEGKITGALGVAAAAVKAVPAVSIELDSDSVSLKVGETVTLSATVHPAGAIQTVAWASSNPNVASVDEYGVVTAKAVGSATITATTEDGRHTAECVVAVTREQTNQPSGPIGGFVPSVPDTNTTITTNPDGSITTTVTDNRTGTVTETTEKPDGSTETVETKKDGTITATTEKPDGSTEVVETRPDGTITATATDSEGGKVEKITTPEEDVTITVTDPEGETLAKVELPAEIPESPIKFVDVPEGHWAESAISQAAGLGLVQGVGGDRFDMDSNMKRGELAEVLFRMSNGNEGYDLAFDDVPADAYYADSVAWAAWTGVVAGFSETEFGPEKTITREQLAVMLYRYAELLKLDTTASADALSAFNDGGNTSSWAVDGMAWCVKNDILQGWGGGILAPGINATRAEVTIMLQRFMALMK